MKGDSQIEREADRVGDVHRAREENIQSRQQSKHLEERRKERLEIKKEAMSYRRALFQKQ